MLKIDAPSPLGDYSKTQKVVAFLKKLNTFMDLFQIEASHLIEDEEYIDTFVIDGNSGILKLMICFVFNILSSSPNLDDDDILLYNSKKDHFWLFFDKFCENDSTIMFINSLKFFQSLNEKAYIWILLEFSQKNLDSIFEKIQKTMKLREFYEYKENLLLSKKYLKHIIEIFARLKKINYKLNLEICESFKNSLRSKSLEKTTTMMSGDIYASCNSATLLSSANSFDFKKTSFDTFIQAPSKFPFINRKFSQDAVMLSKASSNVFLRSAVVKRNTYNEVSNRPTKKRQSKTFNTCSLESSLKKRNQILSQIKITLIGISLLSDQAGSHIKATKSNPNLSSQILHDNIVKTSLCGVQESPRMEFSFNFVEESNVANVGSKSPYTTTILEENPFDGFKGSPSSREATKKIKYYTPEPYRTKPRICLILSEKNINMEAKKVVNYIDIDKNFDTVESESLISDFKCKKNSQQLLEEFERSHLGSELRFKDKPKSISKDQLYRCYTCNRESIKENFLSFFRKKAFYCPYLGYWVCRKCVSSEKRPIPWKVLENFDLTPESVSKQALDEIENLYEQPLLELGYDHELVRKNQLIYQFLVLKREIHLLYDVICEPMIMRNLLKDRSYLALKRNLLSLRNFMELKQGTLIKFLEDVHRSASKHIQACLDCQKRGRICPACEYQEKIYYFQVRSTSICDQCRKLYHSQCFKKFGCIQCLRK